MMRRCAACTDLFEVPRHPLTIGESTCPACRRAGRKPVPGWEEAWHRSLKLQGRTLAGLSHDEEQTQTQAEAPPEAVLRKPGRPPVLVKRDAMISVRLTDDEYATVRRHAAAARAELCDYVRQRLLSVNINPIPVPFVPS